ncbi:MAG TPA: VOC family protein [Hanamia sp.]|jgi:predicted lactoylglutathione lyase|nr:VOC family protein [Hanamia sp.]
MAKQVFINLPVNDLQKSIAFYEAIGFTNNPQFTDETAACMIWSDTIYIMLLTHDKLKQFTTKTIVDARTSVEVSISLSFENNDEVNAFAEKALKAGGREPSEPQDYGFMYQRGVEDPDGHHLEVFYMDINKFPQKQ